MQLQKAIMKMDGLFNLSLINKILNYMESEELRLMGTSGGKNKDVRNVVGFTVSDKPFIDQIDNKDISKYVLYNYIKQALDIALMNYTIRFQHCQFSGINQTDFLKYSINGKYEIHTDDSVSTHRRLSIIVNLNEEYEGGDFIFFDPTNKKNIIHREILKKGTVLIFPSNFLYPHSVEPITKGTRYSLVSWAT